MENRITVSINITDYAHKWTDCVLIVIKNGRVIVSKEIPLDRARVIGWRLIKNGATRQIKSNIYVPAIHTTDIVYFKQWWM